MLFARSLGLALSLLLLTATVQAEMVRDLYSAEVPVADQSAGELAKASRAAMSEVLVKVSGSVNVLQNPVISAALGEARNQVQRYSYSNNPLVPDGLLLKLMFDNAYITSLVIEAGAPIWTANRPVVLVWMVVEDPQGRQFINPETDALSVKTLRAEFSRRAVPVLLPLFDLVDAAALSPDQVWTMDAEAIAAASARYNLQDVLVGRFTAVESGGVAGEWTYLQGENLLPRRAAAENEALFMRAGVALAAEAMAARYAVAASASSGGLTVTVTGVTGYADYAAVISLLERLELVERADVVSVHGDTVTLSLLAKADAAQLATIIEANQRLVPLPNSGGDVQLSYQWQR